MGQPEPQRPLSPRVRAPGTVPVSTVPQTMEGGYCLDASLNVGDALWGGGGNRLLP